MSERSDEIPGGEGAKSQVGTARRSQAGTAPPVAPYQSPGEAVHVHPPLEAMLLTVSQLHKINNEIILLVLHKHIRINQLASSIYQAIPPLVYRQSTSTLGVTAFLDWR